MATPYSTGGIPNNIDVAVGSVFIAVFALAGFMHLKQLHTYGYRFIWSLFCFGFCIVRCLAIGFRIALKDHVQNKVLACIAQILLAAGIAFLFIVNLQMSKRFFGQLHPRHSSRVHSLVTGLCYLVDPLIIIVIVAIIQSYCEMTNLRILQIDRQMRTVCSSILTALAFFPIPIVILAVVLPKISYLEMPESTTEKGTLSQSIVANNSKNKYASRPVSSASTMVDHSEYINEKSQPVMDTDSTGPVMAATQNSQSCLPWKVEDGVPKTGFGETPIHANDLAKRVLVIIIPAILFTIEAGIRTAQANYAPVIGTLPPWYMGKTAFWTYIFGVEAISIILMGLISLPKHFSNLKPFPYWFDLGPLEI